MSKDALRLKAHISALTSITPARQYSNVDSMNRAAHYIYQRFREHGTRVKYQEYKVGKNTYKNVIASFGPDKGPRIIFGAHYDVCGDQPGADDNATGVAVILDLARSFHLCKPQLKYRVDLVTYALEEPPYFRTPNMGSAIHAASLKEKAVEVVLMISVDMIGCFSNDNKVSKAMRKYMAPKIIMPGSSTAIVALQGAEKMLSNVRKNMMKGAPELAVIKFNPPKGTPGTDWSDHMNFWNNDYPGIILTNWYVSPNPNYHKPGDTIDTINFQKLALFVPALFSVAIGY